ncbi:Arc family DNA-binding protein [Bradyrhizobium sp. 144]|uniref:Arc family DNA-binding protein n=1 Tax=Bradyrhizobium sp. 144 TaxID=2782620 RepID=UPI001FF79D20|nr:Arc family DNA-binding protein [Bradyrhizobium sp. 144]MCK1693099.1 Arc family DNA-binding protein [Bradyrhizobium sp. 144]
MGPEFKSRALDKFIVRLPEGMREKLSAAAQANNRTMNAEVVSRLEQSFSGEALLTIKENTAEAEMIWEMSDGIRAMRSEFDKMQADLRELKDRLPFRTKSKKRA